MVSNVGHLVVVCNSFLSCLEILNVVVVSNLLGCQFCRWFFLATIYEVGVAPLFLCWLDWCRLFVCLLLLLNGLVITLVVLLLVILIVLLLLVVLLNLLLEVELGSVLRLCLLRRLSVLLVVILSLLVVIVVVLILLVPLVVLLVVLLVIVLVIPLIIIVILLGWWIWFCTTSHKVGVAYSIVLENWLLLCFDRCWLFLGAIKVVQVKSFLRKSGSRLCSSWFTTSYII